MALLILFFALFSACSGRTGGKNEEAADSTAHGPADAAAAIDPAIALAKERAGQLAAALDDRCLAAQVIITGIDGKGRLEPHMRTLLGECPAGGIMLFRYNLDTEDEAIQRLTAESAALIASENGQNIPPFVTVDHEGGSVNRFRSGLASLPPAGSYWELALTAGQDAALNQIEADSFGAGQAIKRLGCNLNLAPVAEFINDDNRIFLEDRSYGPDPVFAGIAAAAFIRGMEQAGVLCAVKHFPGNAGADPHRFPSVLRGDRVSLNELTAPFAMLIHNGQARALMIAHSAVPAWDSEIASLSSAIMGGWLRDELGFSGIIICDDFSMTAAGPGSRLKPEEAAVRALIAGADMVLVWPPDLRRTHRAIMAALDNGDLSRSRLQEAAQRIIFEKIRMELIDGE
jgi:beta-N-acetylhexosaminidase